MGDITLHNYEAFLLDLSEGNLDLETVARLKAFALAHPELRIDLEDNVLPSLVLENDPIDFKNDLKKEETCLEDEELLNYLEGDLTEENKKAFELKLSRDRELSFTLGLYKKTILIADSTEQFDAREDLKKTEEDLILNNRLLAYLENQLSPGERSDLELELIKNSELRKEAELFSKTILAPDARVVYPTKDDLKKEGRVIALFRFRTVASMAAAVVLLFGLVVIYKSFSFETKEPVQLAKTNSKKENKIENPVLSNPSRILTPEQTDSVFNLRASSVQIFPDKKGNHFDSTKHTVIDSAGARSVLEEGADKNLANTEKDEEQQKLNEQKQEEEPASVLASNSSTITDNANESELSKHTYLLALEEVEEGSGHQKNSLKQGIWKRAVQLAKKANKLGVKSIDGQENSENKFRLSFNSFSVEKK